MRRIARCLRLAGYGTLAGASLLGALLADATILVAEGIEWAGNLLGHWSILLGDRAADGFDRARAGDR